MKKMFCIASVIAGALCLVFGICFGGMVVWEKYTDYIAKKKAAPEV